MWATKHQNLGWAKIRHLLACYLPYSFNRSLCRKEAPWWKSRPRAKWLEKTYPGFHSKLRAARPEAAIVTMHPGTVETPLSMPFVKQEKKDALISSLEEYTERREAEEKREQLYLTPAVSAQVSQFGVK